MILCLSLNFCSNLRLVYFHATYLRFTVLKMVLDWVKRRKRSLASGKILVWSLSSQNFYRTDIKLGWFDTHQIDLLLV